MSDPPFIGITQKEAKRALALLAHLRQIYRTAVTVDGKLKRPVAMDQAELIIASVSMRVLMFDEVPLLPTFAQAHDIDFRVQALETDLALFLLSEFVANDSHVSDYLVSVLKDPKLAIDHPIDTPSQVLFAYLDGKGFEGPIANPSVWVPDPNDPSMSNSTVALANGIAPSQLLNFTRREVPLAEWGKLRIGYLKNIPIRRGTLICYVANKLGGAHYDADRLPADPEEANEFKLLSTAYDWDNQAIMHAGFVMVGLACIELLNVPGVIQLAAALLRFHEERQTRLRRGESLIEKHQTAEELKVDEKR